MTAGGLSVPAQSLWAKSSEDGAWHSLIHHLIDTAAVAREILRREPPAARRAIATDFDLDEEQATRWVALLAGLHDLGKASPAFQRRWPEGLSRALASGLAWSDLMRSARDVPHGHVTVLSLKALLGERGWQAEGARLAAAAVGAHHGMWVSAHELGGADPHAVGADLTWVEARNELFSALELILDPGPAPVSAKLGAAAVVRLAGLTSFCDWIASDSDRFPFDSGATGTEAYVAAAEARAAGALDGIGWRRLELTRRDAGFAGVFPHLAATPRPLQILAEGIARDIHGPAMALIEAPMGEGKTEAAFYLHLQLLAAAGHRGLYVALPTQATGNAMFGRVRDFLTGVGYAGPVDLQLIHGGSALDRSFEELRLKAVAQDYAEDGAVIAGEWFTGRKRALLSAHGVGTVDQALIGVLQARHHFIRLWGLSNRCIVLDEVHAYDVYTGTLIDRLVEWLKALGSSVIVLSATLPARRRQSLLEAYGSPPGERVDYPRLSVVSGQASFVHGFRASREYAVAVEGVPYAVDEIARTVLSRVNSGGCGVCIVNTVARAQALYLELERTAASDTRIMLLHARFPGDQRQALERQVLEAFGRGDARRPKRAVLVGTQVLEQSLDLDFDVMVSDLAPADLLLQRAGRLHRHDRDRPAGLVSPSLYVAGLGGNGDEPEDQALETVYDEHVLLRTWMAIRKLRVITLPGGIEAMVEWTYESDEIPPDLAPPLVKRVEVARGVLEERLAGLSRAAKQTAIPRPHGFVANVGMLRGVLDDEESDVHPLLRAQTRLGDPSLTVVPVVARSGRWYFDDREDTPIGPTEDGQVSWVSARRLAARGMRVSGRFLVGQLRREIEVPPWWKKQPLLRATTPLALQGGAFSAQGFELRLDPALGLITRWTRGGEGEEE